MPAESRRAGVLLAEYVRVGGGRRRPDAGSSREAARILSILAPRPSTSEKCPETQ